MVVFNLVKFPKQRRAHKSKAPALSFCPQKRGVVIKSFETTPRKPNSAKRKVAKVVLSNKRKINVYLEGEGTNKLNPHSVVLVRGRGPRDLPGVRYHAIRGVKDFPALTNRTKGRSKYGIKSKKVKVEWVHHRRFEDRLQPKLLQYPCRKTLFFLPKYFSTTESLLLNLNKQLCEEILPEYLDDCINTHEGTFIIGTVFTNWLKGREKKDYNKIFFIQDFLISSSTKPSRQEVFRYSLIYLWNRKNNILVKRIFFRCLKRKFRILKTLFNINNFKDHTTGLYTRRLSYPKSWQRITSTQFLMFNNWRVLTNNKVNSDSSLLLLKKRKIFGLLPSRALNSVWYDFYSTFNFTLLWMLTYRSLVVVYDTVTAKALSTFKKLSLHPKFIFFKKSKQSIHVLARFLNKNIFNPLGKTYLKSFFKYSQPNNWLGLKKRKFFQKVTINKVRNFIKNKWDHKLPVFGNNHLKYFYTQFSSFRLSIFNKTNYIKYNLKKNFYNKDRKHMFFYLNKLDKLYFKKLPYKRQVFPLQFYIPKYVNFRRIFTNQLNEQKTFRWLYKLTYTQLIHLFRKAISFSKDHVDLIFFKYLEYRLDICLYRLHFTFSIRQSRQIIKRQLFLVNEKFVNWPKYQVNLGDLVIPVYKLRLQKTPHVEKGVKDYGYLYNSIRLFWSPLQRDQYLIYFIINERIPAALIIKNPPVKNVFTFRPWSVQYLILSLIKFR